MLSTALFSLLICQWSFLSRTTTTTFLKFCMKWGHQEDWKIKELNFVPCLFYKVLCNLLSFSVVCLFILYVSALFFQILCTYLRLYNCAKLAKPNIYINYLFERKISCLDFGGYLLFQKRIITSQFWTPGLPYGVHSNHPCRSVSLSLSISETAHYFSWNFVWSWMSVKKKSDMAVIWKKSYFLD